MSICLRCGKYPFCNKIEENKKECDKFIKRKLSEEGIREQLNKIERRDKDDNNKSK